MLALCCSRGSVESNVWLKLCFIKSPEWQSLWLRPQRCLPSRGKVKAGNCRLGDGAEATLIRQLIGHRKNSPYP